MNNDKQLKQDALKLIAKADEYNWLHQTTWFGEPIINLPQDMFALQEIIFDVQPDFIIETGIARGGSLIFYASLLELISQTGKNKKAKVLGIDIEIRKNNLRYIKEHPMFKRINLIEGPSTNKKIYEKVYKFSKKFKKIMVFLDSNHTGKHVFDELEIYAKLVTKNSYCIVFDTIIEDLPEGPERPWGKQNSPMSAAREFLKENDMFEIDSQITNKLLITVARNGYLRRR